MKKIGGFLVGLLILLGFAWHGLGLSTEFGQASIVWSDINFETIDQQQINDLKSKISNLPKIWPFTEVKNLAGTADELQQKVEGIKQIEDPLENIGSILEELFSAADKAESALSKVEWNFKLVPRFLLSSERKVQLADIENKIKEIRGYTTGFRNFQNTVEYLYRNNSRVVVLLQNQNEPRSTGGFMGSLVLVDFHADKSIDWRLADIYSLDRQVPLEDQEPAPEWFHGLSETISLRDANFWPDFPTSAEKIRGFLAAAGESEPEVVVAVNLNLVREILKLTGPVKLDKWDLELNEENFDLGLQFLVGGKVLGRFNVKEPVMLAIKEIFSAENLQRIKPKDLQSYDWQDFLARRNVMAYSPNKKFQTLFDQWGIAGRVEPSEEADNVLHFDFVSVGANKSEKFLWTKVKHNSFVLANGMVENTLELIRTHALREGEISKLLKAEKLAENVTDLLDEELLWTLGAGQNRTYLRVMVPAHAELFWQDNPSGTVTETADGKFKIFEVPAFVMPGETWEATLKYRTKIERGSHNWRPYNLQLIGTPARNQSTILTTISTEDRGSFSAETFNLGKPVDLIDQEFRAVIEFDE